MGVLMEPLYRGISWVLLQWHALWSAVLPGRPFLATNWDWVLALVSLAATVRLVLLPFFLLSVRSQARMRALEPRIQRLQQVHRDDPGMLRTEMMRLYTEERVNPFVGCLPWVLQLPIFLALFHVLNSRDPAGFQPENPDGPSKTLYGWTTAQFDSAASAQVFGVPLPATVTTDGLTTTGRVVAGVLGVLVAVLVFLFARIVVATAFRQPAEGRLLLWVLPSLVLLSSWHFPVGVSLYWIAQGLIVLAMRQWARRRYPPPALDAATIPA